LGAFWLREKNQFN